MIKTHHRKWNLRFSGLVAGLLPGLSLGLFLVCSLPLLTVLLISMRMNVVLVQEGPTQPGMASALLPAPPPTVIPAQPAALQPTAPPAPAPTATPQADIAQINPPPPIFTPPTPTPHPMSSYTIEGLRQRTYPGGTIRIRETLTQTTHYTRYYIDYPSDGLTITGIMQVPRGIGPFPVIILNHGYIPQERYWSGADTWGAAGYLNRHGYLTIAPDFRSWGESDTANSFFSTGQLIDTLNLVSSLHSLPNVDLTRIGMWGHSMGGGITLKALTIDRRIKAAVLYAPVSAKEGEILDRWGPGCTADQPFPLADKCGGAEILVQDVDGRTLWAYADAINNQPLLERMSAGNYLSDISVPVQIHIGNADTVTPPRWSEDIRDALQAAGKNVEYFAYPDQGHLFQGESHWRFMQRVTDFFDRHLTNFIGLG